MALGTGAQCPQGTCQPWGHGHRAGQCPQVLKAPASPGDTFCELSFAGTSVLFCRGQVSSWSFASFPFYIPAFPKFPLPPCKLSVVWLGTQPGVVGDTTVTSSVLGGHRAGLWGGNKRGNPSAQQSCGCADQHCPALGLSCIQVRAGNGICSSLDHPQGILPWRQHLNL